MGVRRQKHISGYRSDPIDIDEQHANGAGRYKRDVREATKYIETAIVVDKAMFEKRNGSTRAEVVHDAIQVANIADLVSNKTIQWILYFHFILSYVLVFIFLIKGIIILNSEYQNILTEKKYFFFRKRFYFTLWSSCEIEMKLRYKRDLLNIDWIFRFVVETQIFFCSEFLAIIKDLFSINFT